MRRDPGRVWSCVTIENIRDSSVIRQFIVLNFVTLRPPLNSSVWDEISDSIYSDGTIYHGHDVVAVVTIEFIVGRISTLGFQLWMLSSTILFRSDFYYLFSFECA